MGTTATTATTGRDLGLCRSLGLGTSLARARR